MIGPAASTSPAPSGWVYCVRLGRPHHAHACDHVGHHVHIPAVSSLAEAIAVVRSAGWYVFGDARPCALCGAEVVALAHGTSDHRGTEACVNASGHMAERGRLHLIGC